MRRVFLSALWAGFIGLSFKPAAFGFVSVSPATVEIFEPAGKKVTGHFSVRNPLDKEVEVGVAVENFYGSVGMAPIPHESWIKLSSMKPFSLKPAAVRDIKYKIKIPKGLSGEVMAMVFFKIKTSEPGMGGVLVERRHGTPVYVIAKGSEKIQVELNEPFAKFGKNEPGAFLEFSINVKNIGNVHLRPRGFVQIYKNEKLLEEAKLEFGFPVYPTAVHSYNARSTLVQWEPGEYDAKFVVYCGDEYGAQSQSEKLFKFSIGADQKISIIN